MQDNLDNILPIFWLIFIVYILYRFFTRKQRKLHAENNLPVVKQAFKSFYQNFSKLGEVKKIETAVKYYKISIDELETLVMEFPHREDWQNKLSIAQDEGRGILSRLLEESVNKYLDKAEVVTSIAQKNTNIRNAIAVLNNAKDYDIFDESLIDEQILAVEQIGHEAELNSLCDVAARYEFKDNYKKALDKYQDALFYALKFGYDNEDFISKLKNKIKELKEM